LYEKAASSVDSAKLAKKIKKLQEVISRFEDKQNGFYVYSDSGDYVIDPFCPAQLFIESRVFPQLFPHQVECLQWLWKLHKMEQGGILGDDMGLGKTVQLASFLGSLFYSELIKAALIIVPKSLISQWEAECQKWAPESLVVITFHGSKAKREKTLNSFTMNSGGICLTTYGMVLTNYDVLNDIGWDYVILDEAHKIRNHTTKQYKAVQKIEAPHKVLLTGTPIMNDLRNLWALFDYACDGQLFGTLKNFTEEFESPILLGNDRKANEFERQTGAKTAQLLRNRIKPHFLRREKCDVFQKRQEQEEEEGTEQC